MKVKAFAQVVEDDDALEEEINAFLDQHVERVIDIKYIFVQLDGAYTQGNRNWIQAFVHYEAKEE